MLQYCSASFVNQNASPNLVAIFRKNEPYLSYLSYLFYIFILVTRADNNIERQCPATITQSDYLSYLLILIIFSISLIFSIFLIFSILPSVPIMVVIWGKACFTLINMLFFLSPRTISLSFLSFLSFFIFSIFLSSQDGR